MTAKNKTTSINVRLTSLERSELEAIADSGNVKLSELVRTVLARLRKGARVCAN